MFKWRTFARYFVFAAASVAGLGSVAALAPNWFVKTVALLLAVLLAAWFTIYGLNRAYRP